MKILPARIALGLVLTWVGWAASGAAFANPDGLLQSQGLDPANPVAATGNTLTINQSDPMAILHWQQFNIAPNEVTRFVQPSTQAMALNRIFDANPSRIFGSLQANGSVILLNPNGVLFGPGAQVNVNGLVASSLNLTDANFLNGHYLFEGAPLGGAVKNAGTIETGSGGFVYLLAPNVENSGIINSPEGHIALAAGTTAYLSNRPDGRGFLIEVTAPAGEALNLKDLVADGGRINVIGRVVNQSGLIQANSVRERAGRIELFASERVNIQAESRTFARGGADGVSPGGTVIALADKRTGATRFEEGAQIDVSGGGIGGDGGFVELSGSDISLGGHVRGLAGPGFRGGTLLIDPHDYTVDQAVFDGLVQNQTGMANISIAAEHTLRVAGVATDPATYAPPGGLTLQFTAGGDLVFSETKIGDIFSLDPSSPIWNLVATAGNKIILEGSSLAGNGGRFDLTAAGNIEIREGLEHSYLWAALGGEIFLKAGGDLIAPSALDQAFGWYSGIRLTPLSGVERTASRLVVNAAGSFLGGVVGGVPVGPGFVLTGGTADMTFGGAIGAPTDYANLTIGQGEIRMNAGGDLYLDRVQDWRGAEEGSPRVDPDNRVALTAGGDIHLNPAPGRGRGLDAINTIYPGSFAATAGGSIFIEAGLSFWPSLTGSLLFTAGEAIEGRLSETGGIPQIRLYPSDPALFTGSVDTTVIHQLLNSIPADPGAIGPHLPQPVRFVTERGDIRNLAFNFNTHLTRKEFEIASGNDLIKINIIKMPVREGTEAVVRANRDIVLGRASDSVGAISFYGSGTGVVRAGGNLDLGDSNGILHYLGAGLLDISVGGNLEMTKSGIATYSGAAIRIHGLDGPESAVGGKVNVGTNVGSGERQHGVYRGIITVQGGDIDIKATGDIDVNSSQVSTFGGGDIRIQSTGGNVNAGSGEPNELTKFQIWDLELDGNGQPVLDANGQPIVKSGKEVFVPGSGIFTFHDDDPKPLPPYPDPPEPVIPEFRPPTLPAAPSAPQLPPFQPPQLPPPPAEPVLPPAPQLALPVPPAEPVFPPLPDKTAEMERLEFDIIKQRAIGHDTASLESALLLAHQSQIQQYEGARAEIIALYEVAIGDYKKQVEVYQTEIENYQAKRAEIVARYEADIEAYKEQANQIYEVALQEYEAGRAQVIAEYEATIQAYKENATQIYERAIQAYKDEVAAIIVALNQEYKAARAEHRKDWKLGDVVLNAGQSVIVPKGGVRGKIVTIKAPNLVVLEGGEIGGEIVIDIDVLVGNLDPDTPVFGQIGTNPLEGIKFDLPELPPVVVPEIPPVTVPTLPPIAVPSLPAIEIPELPPVTAPSLPPISLPPISVATPGGASGLGGLSGATGSISSLTTSSSTAATVAVASAQETVTEEKVAEAVQSEEEIAEETGGKEGSPRKASVGKGKKASKGRGGFMGLQIRRGVTIEVEIMEEPG